MPELSLSWAGRGAALPRPRAAGRRARGQDRDADPRSTIPASSGRTGSSTPSPPGPASSAACIVVDFGTAITYDVVSDEGEYLGGIISPGIEISLEALASAPPSCSEIELGEPRSLIGKTTVDAVRSGIVYGFAGQVDGIVTRLRDELGVERR